MLRASAGELETWVVFVVEGFGLVEKSSHTPKSKNKINTQIGLFNNWPCGSMAERLTTISSSKMKLVYQEVPGSTPGSVNLFLHFCSRHSGTAIFFYDFDIACLI